MGENSKIEWCDHTFNPWIGCAKVSPGCANCYAEGYANRYRRAVWGPNGTRVKTSAANWKKPEKWNAEAAATGTRPRVFCASLADVFEDRDELEPWRAELLDLINRCKNLDWLFVTKRPEFAIEWIGGTSGAGLADWSYNFPHVALGVTVENQAAAYARIPPLLEFPAATRFLSCEPLLGPLDLSLAHIDWVIAGGESGAAARPSRPEWFQSLRDQCRSAGVPFLFKQWGEWLGTLQDGAPGPGQEINASDEPIRVGKKRAGRLLDGREWNEFPKFSCAEVRR